MRIVLTLLLFYVCMSIKAQQQDMTEMKKSYRPDAGDVWCNFCV